MVGRIVRQQLGVAVTAVHHLRSSVNDVVRVSCGERQLVMRLNVIEELDRFRKEAWCLERAAEIGVRGPAVLAIGTEGPYAFMIQSFLAGRRGDALSDDEQRTMWRGLGGQLRRIHAIPVRGFGDERTDLIDGESETGWRRYLDYNVGSLTSRDPLLERQILDQRTQARLRTTFESLARLDPRFGLSHGDPSPWNMILGDDGLLRLIDWGEAEAHLVPHFDFGVILSGRLEEQAPGFDELLDGYGLDRGGYGAIRGEIRALRLLIATDKVRWAIDRKPERLHAKVETLRSLLRDWPGT